MRTTGDCAPRSNLKEVSAMPTSESPGPATTHVRILMGAYNGLPWLEAQLASFLEQSHGNWSLWVSDDGSTDGTREALVRFADRHPGRVARILDGPRRGSAANFLHLLCHPDLPPGIVALSDQDDVWMPNKLQAAVSRLQESPDAPCAWSARYLFVDEDLRGDQASPLWPRRPSLGNAVVQNILSGHTLTLNPAALELVRRAGIRPVPHHDWWIYLLLTATGGRVMVDPAIVLRYRQHGANVMGASAGRRARRLRTAALMDGTLRDWVSANLRALEESEVPLTDAARRLTDQWAGAGRWQRLRLLRKFGIHRQSRAQTASIYLAALLGKL